MRSRRCALLLAAVVTGLAACPSPPPSFRIVDLDEAKRAVEARVLVLVEAAPVLLRGRDSLAADVPKGAGVLVFGIDERSARARAAALARAGNQPVLVFVPRDAEERGRF